MWKRDTYIPCVDSIWYRSITIQPSFPFVNFPSVCSNVLALQTTQTLSSCIFLFPQDHFSRGISTLSKSRLFLFVSGKADGENKSLIYDLEDIFVWQDFVTPHTSFSLHFSWHLWTDRKIKLETGDSSQWQYSVLNPHAAITDPLLPGGKFQVRLFLLPAIPSTPTLVCKEWGLSGEEGGVEMGFWGHHHLYSAKQQQQNCMSSRGLGQKESV